MSKFIAFNEIGVNSETILVNTDKIVRINRGKNDTYCNIQMDDGSHINVDGSFLEVMAKVGL